MSESLGTLPYPRLDLSGQTNPLQTYLDQVSHLHGFTDRLTNPAPPPVAAPLPGAIWPSDNPVGTESLATMSSADPTFTPLAYVDPGSGRGVTTPEVAAAGDRARAGAELAAGTVLGMVGDAPGGGGARALLRLPSGDSIPVRAASEDVGNTLNASFKFGRDVGPATVPIDTLNGGVSSAKTEAARVDKLAGQIAGPDGYISRPIVDTDGNVIEGQHRLEALRQLGVTKVPVHVVQDLAKDVDVSALDAAVKKAQPDMHADQRTQLIQHALGAVQDEGSAAVVREGYDAPPGYGPAWKAALDHLEQPAPNALRAYHGTPHVFAPTERNALGEFDLSKIGTGEGAQVYGHGAYLAENEGIARSYREKLAPSAPTIDFSASGGPSGIGVTEAQDFAREFMMDHPDLEHVDDRTITAAASHAVEMWADGATVDQAKAGLKNFASLNSKGARETVDRTYDWLSDAKLDPGGVKVGGEPFNADDPVHKAAWYVHRANGDHDRAIDDIDTELSNMEGMGQAMRNSFGHYDEAVSNLMKIKNVIDDQRGSLPEYKAPGALYESEITAHPEHMLHWDKPLSEQSPYVQDRLAQLGIKMPEKWEYQWANGQRGSHVLYRSDMPDQPIATLLPDKAVISSRDASPDDWYHVYQGNRTEDKFYGGAGTSLANAQRMAEEKYGSRLEQNVKEPTGEEIYKQLSQRFGRNGGPAAASQATEALRDVGIPALRYYDANSRRPAQSLPDDIRRAQGAIDDFEARIAKRTAARDTLTPGSREHVSNELDLLNSRNALEDASRNLARLQKKHAGLTHNFVIFDPNTVNIIRRYGLAGLLGGGAAAAAGGNAEQ